MVKPSDIRNSERRSGYNHVGYNTSDRHPAKRPYQADVNAGGSKNQRAYKGPRRATALEAAQDYCDYINNNGTAAPASLKSAGHVYDIENAERDPEYEAALGVIRDYKAQQQGKQGYVYCIGESDEAGRLTSYVKIGYSVNPEKRVAELQTGNARKLQLLAKIPGTTADERALHTKYIKMNVIQEWFRLTPEILAEFTEG